MARKNQEAQEQPEYKKGDLFHQGKANSLYDCLVLQDDGSYQNDPELCIMEHRDDVSAQNGERHDVIPGKGITNNIVSALLFERIDHDTASVSTHLVERLSPRTSVVQRMEKMLPFEIVVRNIATGSFSGRFGVPDGQELDQPTCELYYKNDQLNDPMMDPTQAFALGLLDEDTYSDLRDEVEEINEEAIDFFESIGVTLVDFKVEFGIGTDGAIYLADEFSPDTCRLRDVETGESLDKDRYRKGMEHPEKGYVEILKRLCEREEGLNWADFEAEFAPSKE